MKSSKPEIQRYQEGSEKLENHAGRAKHIMPSNSKTKEFAGIDDHILRVGVYRFTLRNAWDAASVRFARLCCGSSAHESSCL